MEEEKKESQTKATKHAAKQAGSSSPKPASNEEYEPVDSALLNMHGDEEKDHKYGSYKQDKKKEDYGHSSPSGSSPQPSGGSSSPSPSGGSSTKHE